MTVDYPIGEYVIVRTTNAGVHAGTLAAVDGDAVSLTDSRRIWYWDGAASLSELATRGTSKPQNCKFPAPVAEIVVREWIEIIRATPVAVASIAGVAPWTK